MLLSVLFTLEQPEVNENGSNVSDLYNFLIVAGVTTNHTGGENNRGITAAARLASTLSLSLQSSLHPSTLSNNLSIDTAKQIVRSPKDSSYSKMLFDVEKFSMSP